MFNTLSINLTQINEHIRQEAAGQAFSYSSRSICVFASCDLKTTACIETQNGQNTECYCLGGHYRESNTACKNCSDHCVANTNQQCVWSTETLEEKCQCLPGYTTNKDGGSCKECDFGYSGNDCKDNFLLILVIVGSVAGGVIIALVGAVIGISVRSSRKRKDYERTELLGNDDKVSGGASPMTGHLFPKVRAKPDLGHVNRASNVYEDGQFSQSFPKRDYNEANEEPWYEMNQRERRY
ncbi:mucin-13 [Pelobates fuscus]|uniref:mucin-13 n=1 Tax=Pelobates fuscus TaxID=191477 RepID=UPI002FE4CF2E